MYNKKECIAEFNKSRSYFVDFSAWLRPKIATLAENIENVYNKLLAEWRLKDETAENFGTTIERVDKKILI